jgi:alanine dehydrogenase
MLIGVPREVKDHEYRVGLVPASVHELTHNGHQVLIETQAGVGIGFSDDDYRAVGATIAADPEEVFAKADMIVKVKEPQPQECRWLRPGQTLFTYLHLAAEPSLAEALVKSGCTAIAYETVTDDRGGLPLLSPMSEVAGRMSIQVGARCLEKYQGGSGVLLGGVPGVPPAKVVILGAGKVGTNAARMAMGMEARVTVLDKSLSRLYDLDLQFGSKITTLYSTMDTVEQAVANADLVVGAVLIPGAAAPRIVSAELIKKMRPGSVVIDLAASTGGNCALTQNNRTIRPNGVTILGDSNLAARMPEDASTLFGNNVANFLKLMIAKDGSLQLDFNNEIIRGSCIAGKPN